MLKKLIHSVLDFFLPRKCIGCGKERTVFCGECLLKTEPAEHCGGNVFAAADYSDPLIKKAVWLLKYRGIKQMAEPLAEMLNTRCSTLKHRVFNSKSKSNRIIIPVPLSKQRLRERGFNQAELIARRLAEKSGIELRADVLYKIMDTPTQVSIKDRQKRLKNLNGAFAVKNPSLVKGKNIILIDDVITTGATLKECRKVLRAIGAKKIISLAAARG